MNPQVNLILKVAIASTVLSVIVKYGGRFLPIAPTSVNALIAVLLPTVIMATLLLWRWLNVTSQHPTPKM
jgi:hypothetical protein